MGSGGVAVTRDEESRGGDGGGKGGGERPEARFLGEPDESGGRDRCATGILGHGGGGPTHVDDLGPEIGIPARGFAACVDGFVVGGDELTEPGRRKPVGQEAPCEVT